MKTFECIIAPVKNPDQDETVLVDAEDPGHALLANHDLRPGTFVKSWRIIADTEEQ